MLDRSPARRLGDCDLPVRPDAATGGTDQPDGRQPPPAASARFGSRARRAEPGYRTRPGLHTQGNQLVKVTSDPESHNRGWLCVKGRFGHEFINRPDRLKTPLIRKEKGGDLEPASWDDAIGLIAERLSAVKKENGPDAIGGLSSARCTNEENYAFQKFFRTQIGTNNIDHCARY